jgi:hypothetical protein
MQELPATIKTHLRGLYMESIADAASRFSIHAADEDAVTGALGDTLARRPPVEFTEGGQHYRCKITYVRIRGKGPHAPEKPYGADGAFQIQVRDLDGRLIREKALPFQAKKHWIGTDADVLRQARSMMATVRTGIVIDYSESGYKACSATAAITSQGNRKGVEVAGEMEDLGVLLATKFVDCTIGKLDLSFDQGDEVFVERGAVLHVITTHVDRII